MRFGPMFSNALNGDLIHIGRVGDAVTADAWHVSSCIFEGASTWNTGGWTFNNVTLGAGASCSVPMLMPSTIVMMNPLGSRPGISNLATRPTRRPMMRICGRI